MNVFKKFKNVKIKNVKTVFTSMIKRTLYVQTSVLVTIQDGI